MKGDGITTRGCAVAVAVLLCVGGGALDGANVLDGMPNFTSPIPNYEPPAITGGPGDFASATHDGAAPLLGGTTVSGMPEYVWWYGCSPTSGGMMVGFWDGQPGFGNLYDGDASVWGGSGSSGTRSMVAGTAHITAGSENGYTYGDWHNCTSYPNHESNPDCIADFMKTVNGGSYSSNIVSGLEAYVEWDNPSTAVNESYEATATRNTVPYEGGSYSYGDFKNEIDAGRPVLLDVITARQASDWIGHSVVGYGYQDNMFTLLEPGTHNTLTVGGFAVMDTWSNGTGQSEWVSPSYNLVFPVIDGDGVEWWPFLDFKGASWIYTSGLPGPYDWMVFEGIELVVVPEPATLSLLVIGALAMIRRRMS